MFNFFSVKVVVQLLQDVARAKSKGEQALCHLSLMEGTSFFGPTQTTRRLPLPPTIFISGMAQPLNPLVARSFLQEAKIVIQMAIQMVTHISVQTMRNMRGHLVGVPMIVI